MLGTVKTLLVNQYEAALSMLKACVAGCPDTAWNAPVANYRFSQVVFHTLYFTDLYLGPDDEASFRGQPFHLHLAPLFADLPARLEPFEDPAPRSYDRAPLLRYLEFCRRKVIEVMATETEETLSAPEGFGGDFSRAELHVYNIRHIHHHAAQLGLRLRLDTGEGIEWVGSGWREAAFAERPR
ncbi:MAG TPA: DinB family protein [bacterium]|nr:DinB family protein [bacterium]